MNLEEVKQQIKDNVKWEVIPPPSPTGGQSCGMRYSKLKLHSEELDLMIETGYHKSQMKNRELLLTLFNQAVEKMIY